MKIDVDKIVLSNRILAVSLALNLPPASAVQGPVPTMVSTPLFNFGRYEGGATNIGHFLEIQYLDKRQYDC